MGNVYQPKDPLRNRVYAWEDGQGHAKQASMSLRDVRIWVRKACKLYKVKPPSVQMAPAGTKLSYSIAKQLFFIPDHRNPVVTLHEVAHYICDTHLDVECEPALLRPHSKEWFSIFMWLLIKFGVYERAFLRASLKPYRLRLSPLPPDRLVP